MSDNSVEPRLKPTRHEVVAEKAADALAPPHAAAGGLVFAIDQFIAKALMVAFAMIVDHKFRERSAEVSLTQRDETVQALFLD